MSKRVLPSLVAAATLAFAGAAIAQETDPNKVVEDAVQLLAEKIDGRKEELSSDREALYAFIDEILLPRFDRKFAAQAVLAKHWRSASDEQKTRFVEAFYRTLLRKYADGLLDFEQNMVEVLPYRGDATKKRTKVRSMVSLEDGTKVAVDYDLVRREAGWLLYNVTIEGVSYVRNFRAEFESEIRSTSLDAVIERLEGEAGITPDA